MKNTIKKILKEETDGLQGEFDFNNQEESFNIDKNLIVKKIRQLGSFIYGKNGLDIAYLINQMIKPLQSKIPKSEKVVQRKYADLLLKTGKLTQGKHTWFLRKLDNTERVHVDDKYHNVNKVDSNYKLWSEILTDLLIENQENDLLEEITNGSLNEIKNTLLSNKVKLHQMIREKFKPEDFIDLANEKLGETDEIGNATEMKCARWLESKGFRIMRVGGDGDLIDMFLGIDMITSYKGKIYTIQVKTTEKQALDFIERIKNEGKYKEVDILLYLKRGEVVPVKLNELRN